MRLLIGHALGRDPEIEVVGYSSDAFEAREAIKRLDPDVVTLDVEMPKMQGIEFLAHIMRLRPMPVVMVSSLTGPGTATTIEALSIGAFDCFPKPVPATEEAFLRLGEIVKAAAAARRGIQTLSQRRARQSVGGGGREPARVAQGAASEPPVISRAAPPVQADGAGAAAEIVVAGASTGGIEALSTLLAQWPADCPPTLLVQHLPAGFTKGFARRLDAISPARVEEAADGMPLERGRVYLAPGGSAHLTVGGLRPVCALVPSEPVSGHRPSVDVLFRSVARRFGKTSVGIILTGMGSDGAAGMLDIRSAGGLAIGQDEASSLVYGMPKAAMLMDAIDTQLPLESIARHLFNG
ncbi:protein-glutamate methylesterase/protein-glutamine glutaminase [Antarcticirhabdus aurantiaca]|uniref:Chemotaxis response regulator protein-glutamate methylesterase n=2 Tax=Antarcticirhabdus aurantiaca TaxID=2606717 RepID=A0ACD4NXB9_9HYPH|nr:chemotaxis response regulator protein-glutamate methylesterase [Jeongeuplla avenae]